jgi:outer membrane receptor protein involved in Fe transport
MKHSLLLILLSFLVGMGFSQMPGGMGAGRPGGGQNMNMGRLYGKILDAKTNKPVEAVSIQLIQNKFDTITKKRKDTIISGMLTTKAGNFSLENLPIMGNFRLKITAIGFKTIEQKVAFELKFGQGGDMTQALNAIDKDLGNIKIEEDAQVLEAVTVSGSKALVTSSIDRKVFNVEKNLTSVGGSAIDVMRNVPSLNVDIDGNVTLRNNTPTIFVDGRPTTLTLEQIPADAIQSVEVITNPSAKFDASGGTAGILNIVLKKNRKAGYNGNLRAGIDQRGKYNVGGDINVRQGKVNAFASAMYNQRKSISNGTTDRLTLVNDPNTFLLQKDKNISEGYFAFLRGGFDFFIDNRNTLSLSGVYVNGKFKPESNSDIFVDTLYNSGKTTSFSNRLSNSTGEFKNRGAVIGFKHNFAKAGKEWTADANFNKSRNENENLVFSNNYTQPGGTLTRSFKQLLNGGGETQFITMQTDFVNPLTENSKLEMGARAQMRKIDSRNDISFIDGSGNPVKIPQLSSRFLNKDHVYAGYATFTNKIKDFGYQLGLRAESSDYNGDVKTVSLGGKDTLISYSNSFPISFFPSIFLSQKFKKQQEMQLNFSRRINRPNFFQLFPFTDYSDTLNLSRGNPNLVPEFTYSFELSYTKTYLTTNSFLASVYYKFTDKLITRYQVAEPNAVNPSDSNLINTYINANSSYVGGLELISRHAVAKWWDLTTNLNLYTSKINITDPKLIQQDNIYSWFGKINNSFKLPKNFTLQISGDYQSKTVLPPGGSGGGSGGGGFGGGRGGPGGGMFGQAQSASQGYVRANYGVDMALRFDFLKEKRASLTLNFGDVFRTRRNDVFSESGYFVQNSFRRRDPQFFRLNFNWRFGKFDVSLFKRKNMKGDAEGMQNGMQGVQQ